MAPDAAAASQHPSNTPAPSPKVPERAPTRAETIEVGVQSVLEPVTSDATSPQESTDEIERLRTRVATLEVLNVKYESDIRVLTTVCQATGATRQKLESEVQQLQVEKSLFMSVRMDALRAEKLLEEANKELDRLRDALLSFHSKEGPLYLSVKAAIEREAQGLRKSRAPSNADASD